MRILSQKVLSILLLMERDGEIITINYTASVQYKQIFVNINRIIYLIYFPFFII